MNADRKGYSFDELHDRLWQITPAAWVIAKSSAPAADLEDIQIVPDKDGATMSVKFKTAARGEVTIRGQVLANGDVELLQPEDVDDFGNIFDKQADERFAAVIARAVSNRSRS